MRTKLILTALLLAATVRATPAEDREWATRVACELNTATDVSLPDLTWQQGTTPRLSLDQYRQGKSVNADSNVTAIVRFGPSATSTYFVTVTNYATSGNGYLVDIPTVGTNTTGVTAGWWYTAYFEKSGKRFWTGNGRLDIIETTSTEDALNWQAITSSGEVAAEALLRIAGDAANSNHVAAVRTELLATNAAVADRITGIATNYLPAAALAATALQPSWAVTGTVSRAQAAYMLATADGDVWTEIGTNGTLYLVQVTNALDTDIISIIATSAEYNGPAAGEETVFAFDGFNEGEQKYVWASMTDTLDYELGMPQWWLDFEVGDWALPAENMDLPATLYPSQGGAVGTVTIDYSRWMITNRYQIATQTGTVILISEHNESTDAHPTLPRHSDVTNTVSAATNGLLSKAEAAATYLPITASADVFFSAQTPVAGLPLTGGTAITGYVASASSGEFVLTPSGGVTNTLAGYYQIQMSAVVSGGAAAVPFTVTTNGAATAIFAGDYAGDRGAGSAGILYLMAGTETKILMGGAGAITVKGASLTMVKMRE